MFLRLIVVFSTVLLGGQAVDLEQLIKETNKICEELSYNVGSGIDALCDKCCKDNAQYRTKTAQTNILPNDTTTWYRCYSMGEKVLLEKPTDGTPPTRVPPLASQLQHAKLDGPPYMVSYVTIYEGCNQYIMGAYLPRLTQPGHWTCGCMRKVEPKPKKVPGFDHLEMDAFQRILSLYELQKSRATDKCKSRFCMVGMPAYNVCAKCCKDFNVPGAGIIINGQCDETTARLFRNVTYSNCYCGDPRVKPPSVAITTLAAKVT